MSNVSSERLTEITSYVAVYGKEKAAIKYEISLESLNRYLRKARELEEEKNTKPNVLIFDIENAPAKAGIWRAWKADIPIDLIFSPWFMLSWSAKWLFEDKIYSSALTPEEAINEDDKRIVSELWEFIDHADIIIGHNIVKFDTPKMNTRYLMHGMKPPSPYKQIDTLMEAKKNFSFESNKLDYIARMLGVNVKADVGGAKTWAACIAGDADALKRMEEYNQQDINVTEDVYVKLRPWIKNHPNVAMYYQDDMIRCRNCGSTDLKFDGNFYTTPLNKYSTVRCSCGAIGRARVSALNKSKRDSLIASCPV